MIEKINEHYSFTAPATIFNEEALTTLELAARTASKVNECVNECNKTTENVEKYKTEQWDYLNEIDVMCQRFVGNGIPPEESGAWFTLYRIIIQMAEKGELTKFYDMYGENLQRLIEVERARIDSYLSAKTPPDNTELIDLRIDCEGKTWGSAGSAVRNITKTLLDMFNDVSTPKTKDIDPDFTEALMYHKFGASYEGGYSATYAVSEGEEYLISSYYGFDYPDVIFEGYRGDIVGYGHTSPSKMKKNLFEERITVPVGANTMRINWCDAEGDVSLIKAKKIEGYSLDFEQLTDFITTAITPLETLHPSYVVCETDGTQPVEGHIIKMNEGGSINPAVVADGSTAYKIGTYKVKAGQRVKFSCCANFGNMFYYMFNSSTGEVHTYEQSENNSTRQYLDKNFTIPIGVDRLCVANINESPLCTYMAGVKGASPFEGLTAYVIGDSVSEYNSKATKNYLNYLTERTGITVHNYANSGAGFLNEKENNTHFFGQVLSLPTEAPDVVIVMGSGNDLKYVANNLGTLRQVRDNTLYGQMHNVYNMIMSKYGGKTKVVFIAPVGWKRYGTQIANSVMKTYAEAMKEFCRLKCVPFLDLYHEGGLNPDCEQHYQYFDAEGVHPNADGHKIITSPIYNFLTGVIGMEGE
jgi:lysophospholipase L1-like esterase